MPAAAGRADRPSFFRRLYSKLSCVGDEGEAVIDIDMERKHSYESYSTKDYLRPDWRAARGSETGPDSRQASETSNSSRPQSANQSDRFWRAWEAGAGAAGEQPAERVAKPVKSSFGEAKPKKPSRPRASAGVDAGLEGLSIDGGGGREPSMDTMSRQQMADEIASFAAAIGISPEKEPQLMDIAEEFYASPLPEGWKEYWTDDHSVYYVMQAKKHSQWEHPMEHFFKAQVFLRRSGFRQIETEQGKNPPTTDEVKEMADYLGVDIKTEPELMDIVKMAIGAPLPPEWHEDRTGTKYVHVDGAISSNHPLDVYFLETIRTRREEKARVAREGQEAIKRAQREAIERIIKAKGDHFGILGLRRSASKRDIRLQYRALALEVHPDKNRQSGATDAFHILNDAFRECMDMMQATYRPSTTAQTP